MSADRGNTSTVPADPDNAGAKVAAPDNTAAKLADMPLLPRDENGPVFAEPWQAQAFAVVVELTEKGVITRDEWAQQLGETLSAAEARGETDTGRNYYDHWLATLERIVVAKEIAAADELEREGREIRENDHHRREHQLHGGHSHSHE